MSQHSDIVGQVMANLPENRQRRRTLLLGNQSLTRPRKQIFPVCSEGHFQQRSETVIDCLVADPGIRLTQGSTDRSCGHEGGNLLGSTRNELVKAIVKA